MCHSSEQNHDIELESEEKPRHVPREVILRIDRRDDVAPRGGARGHADEGIGGARRRGGGEEGMVRSIHRSLSEPGMGTSAPTILRAAGAAMAASPASASATPAAAAGRRVLERVGFGRRDGVWSRSEQGRRALRTNSPDAELGLLWKFFPYLGFSLIYTRKSVLLFFLKKHGVAF